MNVSNGAGDSVQRARPIRPLAVLFGTPLQFSDRMQRVLSLEFPEVRFECIYDPQELFSLEHLPSVIVFHEAVPGLAATIAAARNAFAGAMIAIACNDLSCEEAICRDGGSPLVSVLPMNTQLDVWLSVFRLLLCGHHYVPAECMRAGSDPAGSPTDGEAAGAADPRPCDAQLTQREMEILPLIAQGLQNKMIAGELGLSEHTVKLHTHNIFSKLRVTNRTGAANWYLSQAGRPKRPGGQSHAG